MDRTDGWIGIDTGDFGQKYIRDVQKGMPFNDSVVSEIKCENTLEHIEDLLFVLNEFWRVLKPDGVLYMNVPDRRNDAAYKDPTHVRFFSLATFEYFQRKSPRHSEYGYYPWEILELNSDGKSIIARMKPKHKDNFDKFQRGEFKV